SRHAIVLYSDIVTFPTRRSSDLFRDLTLTGNTRWFSALIVLIAVHSIGLFLLNNAGVITLEAEPFPWPAAIVGGLIFGAAMVLRSEEHTSELQSRFDLVCRLLLE